MAAISWFLYLSLTLRNTWLNFILDRYFHYLLWYAIFLPTDNKYSITASKCHENNIHNGMIVSLATIMLKLQVLWLYLDAGFGKWLDPLGGWTFGYDGVPALDSYARHTLGARYLYGILGPFGLRLLTPVVVYVEMLSVPIAIVGSYFANSMLVYTAIGLICALHIGIAITLRNTVLLSLVACSVCLVFLPLGWTGACGRRNLDHTKSNGRLSLISKILILSMAGGCLWLEVFSESCDQSVRHIWSTVLHNRWNVFVGSEEYVTVALLLYSVACIPVFTHLYSNHVFRYVTWEIAPGRLADGSIVDVWGRGSTVDWRLPGSGAPSTSTARPGRWRSFPYLAGIEGDEGDVLWGYLCDEWNREHDASHHPETKLQEFNFFMLQANVLPNMGFSTTRKRLIKSIQCGVEGIDDTVNENETIFGSVVGSTDGNDQQQDENRHAGGRRGDNDSRGDADSEL
jgi:hypothetical protein